MSLLNRPWAVLTVLTAFAVAVQGYHPYAEDGGLYLAGIRKLLDPALYPAYTAFVVEHLRFSMFAPFVAGLTRLAQVLLEWILLLLFLSATAATLTAAWMLATRAGATLTGRAGAAALLAAWLTMPIAGTSLMLMDPYLTARSLSTPLVLLALCWTFDVMNGAPARSFAVAAALVAASIMHPLMAGYGAAAALLLGVMLLPRSAPRRYGPWLLGAAAFLLGFVTYLRAPVESAAYRHVALTRYYWFPFRWHWYEQLGLIGPLLVLFVLRRSGQRAWIALADVGVALGLIALAVAIAFSRTGLLSYQVASLQPLRSFQVVYEIMIVLLGAWLGERFLSGKTLRWALLLSGMCCLMYFVERQSFPASQHLETPWRHPANPWEQAFLWVRKDTPANAVFALDAHYIGRAGEDAQSFRAIAERSALPDYSKDGGEASITPALTQQWMAGVAAQTGLDQESDAMRLQRLVPLGADWILLERHSPTAWPCPYANSAVKVCRIVH